MDTNDHNFNILEHPSIQKQPLEPMDQLVKTEAAETDNVGHLRNTAQLKEDGRDSKGNLSDFIKSEPTEDDEPSIKYEGNFSEIIKNEPIEADDTSVEYSHGDTIYSISTLKDEPYPIEFEEQQLNQTDVKSHRIIHGEDKFYECPYCQQRFSTISNRNRHKATHEGIKREDCDICGKSIAKNDLKQHKKIHSDVKAYKCDLCEKSYGKMAQLRYHMRKHTGEKPFKCKYCECSFAHGSNRVTHMRLHFGDYVYRCELCPLAFPVRSELRMHLTSHKNDDLETRRRNMKALKEAETELQLKFSKKESSEHGEDKTYECPYCPRKFSNYSNMYYHKKSHETIKREACDICGKSIAKRSLNEHKRIHSNEKMHKCDFCEKSYAKMSHLQSHMRRHTGEKPYKCKYCERSFSHGSHRIKHMRFHLGENVHRCELCPLAFPVVSELREHFTAHKNEDPETRERNMKALKEAEAKLQLKLSKEKYIPQPSKEENSLN